MCCAPELWDLLNDDDNDEQTDGQESQETVSSLAEENETLRCKIVEFEENEKAIIREAQGISSDNTRLVQEINRLSEEVELSRVELSSLRQQKNELIKLQQNNKTLAVENSKLKQSNTNATMQIKSMKSQFRELEIAHGKAKEMLNTGALKEINNLKRDYKDLQLTHEKAQEIAVSVKNKLSKYLKDAEGQIQEKNRIIREITKTNEKLKAENVSYAEITENIRRER